MTPMDRRTREKQQVQERILNAARDLFAAEGFEAVTMRRIAEAIEYTPGALYVHFRDKAELIRALCKNDFEALRLTTDGLRRSEADPVRRIWAMGHGYLAFAAAHPNHYKLMFMTSRPAGVEPSEEDLACMDDPDRDGYAAVVEAAGQAMAQGRFRADLKDPELVAQTLWGALHGVAALQITYGQDPLWRMAPWDERARDMAVTVLRGILRDPAEVERMPDLGTVTQWRGGGERGAGSGANEEAGS
jgi:AcrR family transcriptional regulator